jgi:glutamyl-tRNA reductase
MQIDSFYVAGINYKKTDAAVRGQFAVQQEQYEKLLNICQSYHLSEVFVISTCNRTEIYGIAPAVQLLMQAICAVTTGSAEVFNQLAYIKQGKEAITHLFSVAAGLDSQILGDYEITGQLKQAVSFAKKHNMTGAFTERLINTVLQSSKAIRTQTQLSSGTVSVAFAAVSFLKQTVAGIADKKILLIGTGKIGRNTCKNLVDYAGAKHLTLINRTADKAEGLAKEMQLRTAGIESLQQEVTAADVVIVSTNAATPIITAAHLQAGQSKILIDLSVPNNIDATVATLPGITLMNVDGLSKINDATLAMRAAEVPKAKEIIAAHIAEFKEWYRHRKHVPVLQSVKQTLTGMQDCGLFSRVNTTIQDNHSVAIQKAVNNMAVKLKKSHNPGCHYIETLNDFLAATI